MAGYGQTDYLSILFAPKVICLLTSEEKRESTFYAKATCDLFSVGYGK